MGLTITGLDTRVAEIIFNDVTGGLTGGTEITTKESQMGGVIIQNIVERIGPKISMRLEQRMIIRDKEDIKVGINVSIERKSRKMYVKSTYFTIKTGKRC